MSEENNQKLNGYQSKSKVVSWFDKWNSKQEGVKNSFISLTLLGEDRDTYEYPHSEYTSLLPYSYLACDQKYVILLISCMDLAAVWFSVLV